jgi:hypothetical protein
MKSLIRKLKIFLTADVFIDGLLNAQERILALEIYVKDLKYACDKLGFDPSKMGIRELDADELELSKGLWGKAWNKDEKPRG